jgi:hypothetical protein
MANDQDSGDFDVLLRYGRLLAITVVKLALAFGGLVAIFFGVWWVNANVLEPTFGTHALLSSALYLVTVIVYVWLLAWMSWSDTELDSDIGSTVESENWGYELKEGTGDWGWGRDGGGSDGDE